MKFQYLHLDKKYRNGCIAIVNDDVHLNKKGNLI